MNKLKQTKSRKSNQGEIINEERHGFGGMVVDDIDFNFQRPFKTSLGRSLATSHESGPRLEVNIEESEYILQKNRVPSKSDHFRSVPTGSL